MEIRGKGKRRAADEESWESIFKVTPGPRVTSDPRWKALLEVQSNHGALDIKHFRMLWQLGSGDLGTVYAAQLRGSKHMFAVKVMDTTPTLSDPNEERRRVRATREKETLELLDHPFLPTLYASFHRKGTYIVVMEYCSGGTISRLRQRQQSGFFDLASARFYTAELLLALEYLHMKGIVYRDLKPENVLIREDGHIMLSDFDLALVCDDVVSKVTSSRPSATRDRQKGFFRGGIAQALRPRSCCKVEDQVMIPGQRVSRSKGKMPEIAFQPSTKSKSLVGTYEFLAPEIIVKAGHGSPVDWWALGIFLYEMLYGTTPFRGKNQVETMRNIRKSPLKFDESFPVSSDAKSLIKALLVKDPKKRLGSGSGAAEIKQHPFFAGINWALIRHKNPPWKPSSDDQNSNGGIRSRSIRMEWMEWF